jgi:GH15 family glucan-1,4-alpha-glucosidase
MTRPPSLDLAVVGNSNIAALIDRTGTIIWGCWPRLDGDPIFCALIDGNEPDAGYFSIDFDDEATTDQAYVRNTAIVRTIVTAACGAPFAITDFAPRVRPRMDYGGHRTTAIPGSNHIRYVTESGAVCLSTDAPVSYIADESAFVLTQPLTFMLHSDESFTEREASALKGFTICTFWYVDALAAIGRRDGARSLFKDLLSRRNHIGLLSEDIAPETGDLWGNFPQTYSMVDIIVAAMRLSKGWECAR